MAAPITKSQQIDIAVRGQLLTDIGAVPDPEGSEKMDESYGYTVLTIQGFLDGVAHRLSLVGYVLDPTTLVYADCAKATVAQLEVLIAAKTVP